MNHKNYTSINDVLQAEFGTKVVKLSLDGGFTCPNRDGTCGSQGCIFCSESGSGDFTSGRAFSIQRQISAQIDLLKPKWPKAQYIAYFQNFTNTYASVEVLRELYDAALSCEGVVGLAIATRPDCLDAEVLALLEEYQQKTYLWVELGLQTIHEETAKFIRRGYSLATYDEAVRNLQERKIKTVVHLILNLPQETRADMVTSVNYVCQSGIWGLKLQMLNILKDTDLADYYENHPFPLMEADEYIDSIHHLLETIPKEVVLHRLTGDGDKNSLIAPRWVLNKRYVLNRINR